MPPVKMLRAPAPENDALTVSVSSPLVAERREWPEASARALTLGGDCVRLATGIPALDTATRGGLQFAKALVIGGAPDAGKSALMTNLARRYALAGYDVAMLIDDEPIDDMLTRWGQAEGIARADLEDGKPDARARLAAALSELPRPILLADYDEDGATLEDVAERLSERTGGKPGVLCVDSLQTIRVRAHAVTEIRSKKDRVDAVIAAIRTIRKRHRHLVIATCELARGSYRSRNAAEQIDDRAAFKESGDIEYAFVVAIVLRTVPNCRGLVDVTFAKNKLGKGEPFRLELNFDRAVFSQAASVDEGTAADAELAKARQLRAKILLAVRAHSLKSANDIARVVRGNKSSVLAMVREMENDTSEITKSGGVYRATG